MECRSVRGDSIVMSTMANKKQPRWRHTATMANKKQPRWRHTASSNNTLRARCHCRLLSATVLAALILVGDCATITTRLSSMGGSSDIPVRRGAVQRLDVAKEKHRFCPLDANTTSVGFVHIAKCAGASYIGELKRVFKHLYPMASAGPEQ
jgi:hypothetical protein